MVNRQHIYALRPYGIIDYNLEAGVYVAFVWAGHMATSYSEDGMTKR
jgi:hypothetical protein